MKYTEITIPNNLKILQGIVFEQQEKLDLIQQQYDNLQHQIKCLLRHQYGKKSEQGIPGQGSLFDTKDAETELAKSVAGKEEIETITYDRKKPRKGQRQFPKGLPRQRIEYDLPEEKKICACGCGQALKKIGEEVLEQLEIVPAKIYILEHVRFKYAGCAHESTVVTAEMPRQPIDKSMAGIDEARKEIRQKKAKPILEEFKPWLDKLKDRVLPKSPLGDAVNYTLRNWQALNRYVEDGLLSIDNNAAERLIKPIKIGVKNYLFAGSDRGAENAAVFYSLIETCKLHHINPYDYLRDVLIRLPTQLDSRISELLPWNWKALQSVNSNDTR